MNIIVGESFFAKLKRPETSLSDSPIHLSNNILEFICKNVAPHSLANARAVRVLPVPMEQNIHLD